MTRSDEAERVCVASAEALRDWLQANHATSDSRIKSF